ncbi:hypothetical protein PHLCEN_2v4530 [Hermanssonia centrifuga]|uniref:Uncharacterized protein n=1 Tax=Hermanssonia centrifuga TaxID=98765 RepID=A0A2R6PNB9_9APHY|nr:hypothetical protein PHLCEN_2v4530 [Hermanssonia centrifuga]
MNKLSGCGPKTTEQRSARVVKNKAHISEGQDLGKQGNSCRLVDGRAKPGRIRGRVAHSAPTRSIVM